MKSMENDLQCPLQLLILDRVVERLRRKNKKITFSDKYDEEKLRSVDLIKYHSGGGEVEVEVEAKQAGFIHSIDCTQRNVIPFHAAQTALCPSSTHFLCQTIHQSSNQPPPPPPPPPSVTKPIIQPSTTGPANG